MYDHHSEVVVNFFNKIKNEQYIFVLIRNGRVEGQGSISHIEAVKHLQEEIDRQQGATPGARSNSGRESVSTNQSTSGYSTETSNSPPAADILGLQSDSDRPLSTSLARIDRQR